MDTTLIHAMKKQNAIVFLLCCFQLSSFSQTAWKVYHAEFDSTNHTITIFYIDSGYSFSDNFGHANAWQRIEFDTPKHQGGGTVTDILYAIDCNQKSIVEMEEIKRKHSNETVVLKTKKFHPSYNDWISPSPNSNVELFLQTACKLFMPK
jgi:hypothetical protein